MTNQVSLVPRIPTEDLTRQWNQIGPEILGAAARVLPKGKYTLGPELAAFETEFATFIGTAYSIGMSSGTAALHLALLACGVDAGDEVITVPNTYVATVFAISYCRATPVFVDVDPQTYNMNPHQIEAKITARTKVILPVHLYGQAADMTAIMAIARKHNLKIVEDASHAHGATHNGQRAGSFGDVGCFSFYPTKVMGAFGDGGICTTSDPTLYEKIRQLRYMGQRVKYNHEIIGYQERLDELQAAMLRVKLRYLPQWIEKRQQIAAMYDELLTGLPVQTPVVEKNNSHVYYTYTIRAERRDALKQYLLDQGIGCYVMYPYLVPQTAAYQHLDQSQNIFPVAGSHPDSTLCIPMFPELTEAEVVEISDTIRRFYASG